MNISLANKIIQNILKRYNNYSDLRIVIRKSRNIVSTKRNLKESDILASLNNETLEIKVPKYVELYPGLIKKSVNDAITEWFIQKKLKGAVIR